MWQLWLAARITAQKKAVHQLARWRFCLASFVCVSSWTHEPEDARSREFWSWRRSPKGMQRRILRQLCTESHLKMSATKLVGRGKPCRAVLRRLLCIGVRQTQGSFPQVSRTGLLASKSLALYSRSPYTLPSSRIVRRFKIKPKWGVRSSRS